MSAPAMELRRPEQGIPTKPGWYYGHLYDQMQPIKVEYNIGNKAMAIYMGVWYPLRHIRWFGPVPTCVESGT